MTELNDEIAGGAASEPPSPRKKLLRIKDVLAIFPVSRSGWYAGVKKGIVDVVEEL